MNIGKSSEPPVDIRQRLDLERTLLAHQIELHAETLPPGARKLIRLAQAVPETRAAKRVTDVHWRMTSPGGEKTWHADHYHITRQGPAFRVDPMGAVGMLSQALADLSRQIAAAVQSVSASQRESKPAPSP